MLRRLSENNDTRRRIATKYDVAFAELPLGRPRLRDGAHQPLPTHRQPGTLAHPSVRHERRPRTDSLVDLILSLPVFPSLTEAEQEHVIAAVRSFFAAS